LLTIITFVAAFGIKLKIEGDFNVSSRNLASCFPIKSKEWKLLLNLFSSCFCLNDGDKNCPGEYEEGEGIWCLRLGLVCAECTKVPEESEDSAVGSGVWWGVGWWCSLWWCEGL